MLKQNNILTNAHKKPTITTLINTIHVYSGICQIINPSFSTPQSFESHAPIIAENAQGTNAE